MPEVITWKSDEEYREHLRVSDIEIARARAIAEDPHMEKLQEAHRQYPLGRRGSIAPECPFSYIGDEMRRASDEAAAQVLIERING